VHEKTLQECRSSKNPLRIQRRSSLGNSPKAGRKQKLRKLRRSSSAVRSAGEEIWTIGFYVQEELRRSLQKEETDSRRISCRNPVSRWIGRSSAKFSLWRRSAQEEQIWVVRSGQIPDSRRICGSCTRFSHRDIGHREIGILEVVRIGTSIVVKSRRGSGPSVGRGHVAEIKCHRHFGASGNRHSRGQEIGEVQIENSDII
jgi:hypothetical protein